MVPDKKREAWDYSLPEKQYVYKIMILGDGAVGKTSLIRRFVENRFSEEYLTTIGVEFLKKEIMVDQQTRVTLVLWDVAGQAKWTQFKKSYYQGSVFIIAVFDVTNIRSYYNLKQWVSEAQEILKDNVDFAIFANKIDLLKGHAVPEFDDYNNYKGFLELIKTSAKTGENVNDTFFKIAKFLVKKIGKRG